MKKSVFNHQDLELNHQIGVGSFGKVFSAVHKPTNKECAVKIIDLETSEEDIDEIQKEIEMLSTCNNDHVTRYFGCFVHEFELWIVMEFLNSGSCLDLVKSIRPDTLPEPVIADILGQFLEGLQYLHRNGKIHRDIKAANILMSSEGDIKIADFGVAAQLSTYLSRRNTFVGTPFWMAPEIINQLDYSFEADIWSFGITAIELACGRPPRSDVHPMEALMAIPRGDPPRLAATFSETFQDFVAKCLQMDPAKRATLDSLMKHQFLASRNKNALKKLVNQREKAVSKPEYELSTIRQAPSTRKTNSAATKKRKEKEKGKGKETSTESGNAGKAATKSTKATELKESKESKEAEESNSDFSSDDFNERSEQSKLFDQPNTSANSIESDNSKISIKTTPLPLIEQVNETKQKTSNPDNFWDFDTLKPHQSLEKILENPPNREEPKEIDTRTADSSTYKSMNATNNSTLGSVHISGGVTSGVNLARIFSHAGRKFRDPTLEEVSNLLRTDPLTVGVEGYLIKKIGKQAIQQFDLKPRDKPSNLDAVERILLEKYMTEIRDIHGPSV